MTPAWAEAWLGLTGALRLARGDAGGLGCFNPTEAGFWRSFRAAVLCYPLYLILLSFPIEVGNVTPIAHDFRYYAVDTIRYVVAWVAFPLMVLPLVDWLGRGDGFFRFMVAYNWCQVPQTVAFTLVALIGAAGALPVNALLLGDLVVGIGALVYEWYVARVALAVSGARAVLVIVFDMILATVLSYVSAALY